MERSGWWRVRLPALVALVVATALAFGSVFFQITEGGAHAHGAGGVSPAGVAADALGVVLAAALVVQLMVGYRLIRVTVPRFRRVHIPTAWTVGALVGVHGLAGIVHSLQPPVETLPLLLDVVGMAAAGLVVVLVTSGYRLMPKALDPRLLHRMVAPMAALVVIGHVGGAILHVLTG